MPPSPRRPRPARPAQTWLDEATVFAGTKCNRLLRIQLPRGGGKEALSEIAIPPSRTGRPQDAVENCGTHAIALNPARTALLSGGSNPCDTAVWDVASMKPVAVFEGHVDWVFGLCWVTNDVFVTASRDTHVGIWKARLG